MIAFDVKDMTCGHCASTITRALTGLDPNARVSIDLSRHRVTVDASDATAAELQQAIAEAGYTPEPAETTALPPAAAGRSCCGHCH